MNLTKLLFIVLVIFPFTAEAQIEIYKYPTRVGTYEVHVAFGQYPYVGTNGESGMRHEIIILPNGDTIRGFPSPKIEMVLGIQQFSDATILIASLDRGQLWECLEEGMILFYENEDHSLEIVQGGPEGFFALTKRLETTTVGFIQVKKDGEVEEIFLDKPIPTIVDRAEKKGKKLTLFGFDLLSEADEIKVGTYKQGWKKVRYSNKWKHTHAQ